MDSTERLLRIGAIPLGFAAIIAGGVGQDLTGMVGYPIAGIIAGIKCWMFALHGVPAGGHL